MNQQNHNETSVRYTNAVSDETANHFTWGSIQWLCSNEFHAGGNLTFGYVQLEPGQKNPRHYHPNRNEVLSLSEGELEHSLDDRPLHLTAGMSIFIPHEVSHDVFNRGSVTGDRQIVMLGVAMIANPKGSL